MVAFIVASVVVGCTQNQGESEAANYSRSVYSDEKISQKITDIAVEIKKKVESHWVQPESATNGMAVKMTLMFYPDGSLKQSKIMETSGFEELDISALDAVKRSEPFMEIKDLSENDFERYFSSVTFHFMVVGKQ